MMACLKHDVLEALEEEEFKVSSKPSKIGLITGEISYEFIDGLVEEVKKKHNVDVDVIKVENNFFGKTITVSGLLTGADIIGTIKGKQKSYDKIIIPKNCLRDGDVVFLDDLTIEDAEQQPGFEFVSVNETDGYRFVEELLK